MFDLRFTRKTEYILPLLDVTLDLKHQLFDNNVYQFMVVIKLHISSKDGLIIIVSTVVHIAKLQYSRRRKTDIMAFWLKMRLYYLNNLNPHGRIIKKRAFTNKFECVV